MLGYAEKTTSSANAKSVETPSGKRFRQIPGIFER